MPPPELTRDAPGLNVLHPIEVGRLAIARHEHRAPVADRRDRRRGKGLGIDVPLISEEGLDHNARAITVRYRVHVRIDFGEQACGLQTADELLARGKTLEPMIRQRFLQLSRWRNVAQERLVAREIEIGLDVEDIHQRQIVTPAHLEVVEVVGGSDLDRAGAFLRIGIFIGNDRDTPPDHGQNDVLADEIRVAFVVRMHRHRRVAEHGLGSRGRYRDEGRGIARIELDAFKRIANVPEVPLHLDLLHLEIGDGGEQLGVPVDQPLVLVDEALAVKLNEHLAHGAREAFVHGEALARPVAGGAEPLQLLDDGAARLRFPRPHLFEEFFAAERAAFRLLAFHELTLDHHLGRDAGMVGAGLPEHVAAAHALETGEHVLERIVERMAHMQRAGNVGRRNDDAIGSGVAPLRPAATECARLLPHGVDASLDCGGLVCLIDHCCFVPAVSR